MATKEAIQARLDIRLLVECPECEHQFDLVSDTDLNEEGWLLNIVLPEKDWTTAHANK